jgi:serine/threonine-protein kinase
MVNSAHRSAEVGLPRRVGRYEAFLQIGSGGMARVYLAVDRGAPRPDDLVVVKMLRREMLDDEHVLASFTDEARIAMRLQHPNVIRTRDVVVEPPDYLLAMEFLDGQSLLEVLRRVGRAKMPLDEHLYILTQVLSGLTHAHELRDEAGRPLGIVHRDVSPSNVLVSYGGEVKLLDFGIAKATGALAATQDGVVKGKVGYAAPEQCLGKPADPRSDVYAVGVMLWEAIAGRRRSPGETWQAVLHGRIEDSEPAIEDVCPDVPLALSAVARRALGHEPETRYPSAREFREDLEAYLAARRVNVGPERIAALLRPHFERDRAERRQAVEAYLEQRGRSVSGPRKRVLPPPHPPQRAAPPSEAEEDTSKIPVDDALLLQSMRDSVLPPPTAPTSPTRSGIVPSDLLPLPEAATAASPFPISPNSGAEPTPYAGVPDGEQAGSHAPARRSTSEPSPFAKKRPEWPAFVATAAALASVAALAVSISHRGPADSHATATPAPVVPADPAPLPGAAGGPSAPAVNPVRVRISVTPPSAAVRLDDRLLTTNPFVATFPRDAAPHELRVTADGFREEKQIVSFEADVDVELSLKPAWGGPRTRSAAHALAPLAPSRASPEPRATAAGVEPGMDLQAHPGARGKRTLDEKDPYGP